LEDKSNYTLKMFLNVNVTEEEKINCPHNLDFII
jgi:hypothetical protein